MSIVNRSFLILINRFFLKVNTVKQQETVLIHIVNDIRIINMTSFTYIVPKVIIAINKAYHNVQCITQLGFSFSLQPKSFSVLCHELRSDRPI